MLVKWGTVIVIYVGNDAKIRVKGVNSQWGSAEGEGPAHPLEWCMENARVTDERVRLTVASAYGEGPVPSEVVHNDWGLEAS